MRAKMVVQPCSDQWKLITILNSVHKSDKDALVSFRKKLKHLFKLLLMLLVYWYPTNL